MVCIFNNVETRASLRILKGPSYPTYLRGIQVIMERIIKIPVVFRERGWGDGEILYSRDHGLSDRWIRFHTFLGQPLLLSSPHRQNYVFARTSLNVPQTYSTWFCVITPENGMERLRFPRSSAMGKSPSLYPNCSL